MGVAVALGLCVHEGSPLSLEIVKVHREVRRRFHAQSGCAGRASTAPRSTNSPGSFNTLITRPSA